MSDDLISRQAVIEINRSYHGQMPNEVNHRIWKEINELPSAQPELIEREAYSRGFDQGKTQGRLDALSEQPERLTDDDFETIRIHLNAYKEKLCNQHRWEEANEYQRIIDRFMAFASAQPEHTNSCYTNSWCIDCKEYDTENKCCHRYNRVIKQTLDDAYRHGETEAEARFHAQQRWIPCSERLPEDGQEILATTTDNAWGDVVIIRTYYKEMHKSVIAWMPLPEPYAERRTDDESI